ncbi:MAG: FtsX-like permease family protein [Bacteroidetes bacterium]|nr:FtsX-like permease family protein [Bacteroidota bacterium]
MSDNGTSGYFKRRALRSRVWATAGITLVLLLMGVIGLLWLQLGSLSALLREEMQVQVYLKEDASDRQTENIDKQLSFYPGVRTVRFVSKDSAAKELSQELGEDFLDFLGYNPLLASFQVHMKSDWVRSDSLESLRTFLIRQPGISDVFYPRDLLDLINRNVQRILWFLAGVALFMAFIAVALIHNSVRLSLYAERFLIRSMQLVGATPKFIRAPYLSRSMWQAVWGWVITLLLLLLLQSAILYYAPQLQVDGLPVMLLLLSVSLLMIALGISFLSTWFAVSKYIRQKLDDLYT